MSIERFFTPAEVAAHNSEDDLWVSLLGKVLDLTPLASANKGKTLLKPIVSVAGQDISHWFDTDSGELRTYIDPITSLKLPYTPHGRFLHVPPACPSTSWATDFGEPWWRSRQYVIGRLTNKPRLIKITNMLAKSSQVVEVCSEETLRQIEQRYEMYNSHSSSYTWKHLGNVLDMDKTLQENSIPELSEEFAQLSIDQNEFIPDLQVYYNDDLLPSSS